MPRLFGVGFAPRPGRDVVIRAAYEDAQLEWESLGVELDMR